MTVTAALVGALDARIGACLELPFQVRGVPHRRLHNPFSGAGVLLNPARGSRTRAEPGACPYCAGRTPPTLFYVRGRRGQPVPVVEDEAESLAVARAMRTRGEGDPWAVIAALAGRRRVDATGRPVPLVHPAEPWLARVFLNLTPAVVSAESAANAFVVSVPPALHEADLAPVRRTDREAGPTLPPEALAAVVRSWVLLEVWAAARGLVAVPFINGGKDRASGQSLGCFHSQVVVLGPEDAPPLYAEIARRRVTAGCPVCALLADPGLRVADVGSVAVAVHPAPDRDLTLVVAPYAETTTLADLLPEDLSRALLVAASCLERALGGLPAYNVAVRLGPEVGHLHAEVVPRSGVNVRAGFEVATGLTVLTRDPREVAARLRAEVTGREGA
ncbi:MAG: hypothetical protein Kow00122_10500 [Thermoleophilia bacterium]